MIEMDTEDHVEPRESDNQGDAEKVDPAAATIIGTNVTGINTAPYPGGVIAPAAEVAGEEAEEEELGAINFDALDGLRGGLRETGDEGVSADQRELEADELNG
jgi:hypothetical protein